MSAVPIYIARRVDLAPGERPHACTMVTRVRDLVFRHVVPALRVFLVTSTDSGWLGGSITANDTTLHMRARAIFTTMADENVLRPWDLQQPHLQEALIEITSWRALTADEMAAAMDEKAASDLEEKMVMAGLSREEQRARHQRKNENFLRTYGTSPAKLRTLLEVPADMPSKSQFERARVPRVIVNPSAVEKIYKVEYQGQFITDAKEKKL